MIFGSKIEIHYHFFSARKIEIHWHLFYGQKIIFVSDNNMGLFGSKKNNIKSWLLLESDLIMLTESEDIAWFGKFLVIFMSI